jgi:PAS domain S-box-containing protein
MKKSQSHLASHIFATDKLFKTLIENSNEGVVLLNRTGKLLYISQTARDLFGYPDTNISALKSFSYIHPEDRKKVMKSFFYLVLHPGTKIGTEYRVKHAKGYYKWIESTSVNLLHDPSIKAILNTFRDISDKKAQTERQLLLDKIAVYVAKPIDEDVSLKEITDLLIPDFADYCRIAVINEKNEVVDIASSHINSKKVGLSESLYDSYIHRPESTHGVKQIIESGKPEIIRHIDEALLKNSNTTPDVIKLVKAIKLKSYIGIPLKVDSKVIGAVTFSSTQENRLYSNSDIYFFQEVARRIALFLANAKLYKKIKEEVEYRKTAEAEVLKSEKRFKAIIENSSDAFRLTDKTGKIIYASPSTKKLLGYSLKEHISKKIFDLIHPDDRSKYLDVFRLILKHPKKPYGLIYRILHKNGTYRWMDGVGVNLLDDPNIKAVVSNFRDITDKKKLEMQKDEFLSIASHELKTPTTSIKAFAQVLQKRFEKKQDFESALLLQKMNNQLNRLTNLISDLLDITKIESGKMKFNFTKLSIKDLVKETIHDMQFTADHHKIILKDVSDVTVYADRERVGQVLINLLSNAIKYSPDAKKIEVQMKKEQSLIVISIHDYGIGIPTNKQKHLFERFYRVNDFTKQKFPGLGLGLYISAEIIKRHNGKIEVQSEKGRGTTFSIILPRTLVP